MEIAKGSASILVNNEFFDKLILNNSLKVKLKFKNTQIRLFVFL